MVASKAAVCEIIASWLITFTGGAAGGFFGCSLVGFCAGVKFDLSGGVRSCLLLALRGLEVSLFFWGGVW